MKKLLALFKSKTILGSIFGAASYLLAQPHIGPQEILTAIGGITGIAGIRDAYDKAHGGVTLSK